MQNNQTELEELLARYEALAKRPWPHRQLSRAETLELFRQDLIQLRKLRDRIVALKKIKNS